MTIKDIQARIEKNINKNGVKMYKKISSGGFFSLPTYDKRTVYSHQDIIKLDREGFTTEHDFGILLYNSIMSDIKVKK